MGLVVVDPDEEESDTLCRQLAHLNLEPVAALNPRVAQEICDHTLPELMICTRMDWALKLAESNRRVPVVLAVDDEPDENTLLTALRSGLADVWQLPVENDFAGDRIGAILSRSRQSESQAEARLAEHVKELQRDQRAGRYIQMGMLPPNPMGIDRYRLQHRILPSLILSGDFVDYFRITDRYFALYVADVSGHGASSAFVTVLLKNFSRRLRREYRPSMIREPGEILAWINRELLEQKIDKHVAMILAVGDLKTDTLRIVNGGHFPPAVLVNDEGSHFVEQRGRPVGLFDEVSYEAQSIRLAPGARLVLFSDGVLDAMGDIPLAEKEARLLAAASRSNMDDIWQTLELEESTARDDMTCLTLVREN
ncbi:MAG: PP2C family protein-serine/threonine phosphatase [Pseudomonadales bacterium]